MLSNLDTQPDMACLLAKVDHSVSKGITVITMNKIHPDCLFYKQELFKCIFQAVIQ